MIVTICIYLNRPWFLDHWKSQSFFFLAFFVHSILTNDKWFHAIPIRFGFYMNRYTTSRERKVKFRTLIFWASGGLWLLCIGPQAGWAFLYRVLGFFRTFPEYKMYPYFCLMSMKYEVLLLNSLKFSIGYKFGPI